MTRRGHKKGRLFATFNSRAAVRSEDDTAWYRTIRGDHFGMQCGKLRTKVNSDLWTIVWKAIVDGARTDG